MLLQGPWQEPVAVLPPAWSPGSQLLLTVETLGGPLIFPPQPLTAAPWSLSLGEFAAGAKDGSGAGGAMGFSSHALVPQPSPSPLHAEPLSVKPHH